MVCGLPIRRPFAVHNLIEKPSIYALFTMPSVLAKQSGRTDAANVDPPLATHAFEERDMPLTRTTPEIHSAQYTDPLIVNARLVNLAAEIERNLAARRALRPVLTARAAKGWQSRRASA